jgi:hypothetical protein
MSLLDWIVLGLIKTHATAERAAADVVDLWHAGKLPGELMQELGLSHREYQAWTTGGVSLMTIARWKQTSPPKLDPKEPWFRISGRPGHEKVGYLEELRPPQNGPKNSKRSRPELLKKRAQAR